MIFKDRQEAGQLIAQKLSFPPRSQTVVIGLARGGVVVGAVLSRLLSLPLDVLVVKKIPSPTNSELAIGACAPNQLKWIDWKLAQRVGADEAYVNAQVSQLASVIKEKMLLYRRAKNPLMLQSQSALLVDDGAATGATIYAAVKWLKKKHPQKIVAALPMAPADLVSQLRAQVDQLLVLETPEDFSAVGQFYKHFSQVSDEEVVELLKKKG